MVTRDDVVGSEEVHAPGTVRESIAHRFVRWALLAIPVIVLAERAWALRWMSDDGFINLRVVSQLVHGHGPVFNIGERVETSTSPLWIFTLATGDLLTPVRLEWIAVLFGIVFTLGGIALALLGARVLLGRRSSDELFVPVGAAVLVAYAPLWLWASSGLENGLAFGWLGACLWALARWSRSEHPLPAWSAVVLGLGPLIRPEFTLYSALFLVGVLVGRRHEDRWRDRVALMVWALALPVAYQIFRMGYYGSLVPNPALAKEASGARWGDGWNYLRETVDEALVGGGRIRDRRIDARLVHGARRRRLHARSPFPPEPLRACCTGRSCPVATRIRGFLARCAMGNRCAAVLAIEFGPSVDHWEQQREPGHPRRRRLDKGLADLVMAAR
jgi:hypothetical protein